MHKIDHIVSSFILRSILNFRGQHNDNVPCKVVPELHAGPAALRNQPLDACKQLMKEEIRRNVTDSASRRLFCKPFLRFTANLIR